VRETASWPYTLPSLASIGWTVFYVFEAIGECSRERRGPAFPKMDVRFRLQTVFSGSVVHTVRSASCIRAVSMLSVIKTPRLTCLNAAPPHVAAGGQAAAEEPVVAAAKPKKEKKEKVLTEAQKKILELKQAAKAAKQAEKERLAAMVENASKGRGEGVL
jgi:hypothetical protein